MENIYENFSAVKAEIEEEIRAEWLGEISDRLLKSLVELELEIRLQKEREII